MTDGVQTTPANAGSLSAADAARMFDEMDGVRQESHAPPDQRTEQTQGEERQAEPLDDFLGLGDEPQADGEQTGDDGEILSLSATSKVRDPDTGEVLTWGEARKRMLLHKDYTQKQQERAEIVRQFEAKAAQVEQLRAYLETGVRQIDEVLQRQVAEIPPMPPAQLKVDDPNEYAFRVAEHMAARAEAERLYGLRQQAQQQAREVDAQTKAQRAAAEGQKLRELVPEWRDPEKAKRAYEWMMSGAQRHYGFALPDLDAMPVDHRYTLILRDALAYREQRERARSAQGKVAPPRALPQGQPTRQNAPSFERELADAKAGRISLSLRDSARLFDQIGL